MPAPTEAEIKRGLTRTLSDWRPEEYAKAFTVEERQKLAKEGKAMSDGSFPIRTTDDLKNAVGLAHTPAQRAHIKKNAARLSASKAIPENWASMDAKDVAVLRAIEDAIHLQEADTDGDADDKKVLSLLKEALKVQQGDTS